MADKKGNVLVELVDHGLTMGKDVGRAVGSTVRELKDGKVTPMEVLTDVAHGEVKVLKMTGDFARETARVMDGEIKTLVDQRGNHPDIGWMIRGGGGVIRFFIGALDGIGSFSSWAGSAVESVYEKLGIKPEERKE